MEIGNHFWELEDNCAYNGYTTCMWHNLLNSKILPDFFEENIECLYSALFSDPETVSCHMEQMHQCLVKIIE